jgi:hypothetical protein
MRNWGARQWLTVALMSFLATLLSFFVGFAAPGLDVPEKCGLAGEPYNISSGSAKHQQRLQIFPMHAWCNESYDLVPAWVNPAIAISAILTLTATGYSVALTAKRLAVTASPHEKRREGT